MSLRDEYCRRNPVKFQRNLSHRYATKKLIFPIGNIAQLHHHLRWQVRVGVYSKQKKRRHSFEVASYWLYYLFNCSFSFLFSLTILSILYLLQPNSSYLSLSVLISSLSISRNVCSG